MSALQADVNVGDSGSAEAPDTDVILSDTVLWGTEREKQRGALGACIGCDTEMEKLSFWCFPARARALNRFSPLKKREKCCLETYRFQLLVKSQGIKNLGILERNQDVLILVMSCACTVCCICFDILNENRSTK